MRVLVFISALVFSSLAQAEDVFSGIRVSGSLDMNYVWNFNQPKPVTPPSAGSAAQPAGNNKYRAFDLYHDDFNLALAELVFQKTKGDVSAFVSLDFGHAADVMSPNDEVSKHIAQAYLVYAPKSMPELSLKAGKMYTHLGYELIKTSEDWNYSRSLLFAYAIPYWHTGVSATYSLLDGVLVPSLYLYNTNAGLYQQTRGKSVGAQVKLQPAKDFSLFYNFLSGPEISSGGVSHVRTLHEAIVTYQVLEHVQAAADAVFGMLTHAKADERNAEWFTWTASLKWTRGSFHLSPRWEMFWDRSGTTFEPGTETTTAVPQLVQSGTLTAGFDLGDGLQTRLEYRHDFSSEKTFVNRNGEPVGSQTTLTAGILYDF